MINVNEARIILTALSPILADIERKFSEKWNPQDMPVSLMSELADALTENWDTTPAGTRRAILDEVETFLVMGDDLLQQSIATGFLESIVNSILRGSIDRAAIESMLGPESLEYCHQWEHFSDNMSANPLPKLADAGISHIQKAKDGIRKIERWLSKHPNARPGDRAAAENVMLDLRNALNGE